MLVALQSADVGLVRFDPLRPLERRQVADGAGLADAVRHEPSRLVADSERAAQLHRGDPVKVDGELVDRGGHFTSDSLESLSAEADLMEKRLLQSLHICVIADVRHGFVEARFEPQCGQTGPSGHITDSSHFRAFASVENIFAIAWTGSAVRCDRPGPPLPTFPEAMSTSRA